jgi:hypothetical protein
MNNIVKVKKSNMTDKEKAIETAKGLGQGIQLQRLFDFAPASNANYWAVVDFNKPSSEERLFIFSLRENICRKYIVAHGKKSGEKYATVFSNEIDSNCSSLGIFKTRKSTYKSEKNGRSLRIIGLEPSNSNALVRNIVIHKAEYAVSNHEGTGMAGPSEGCFAVHPSFINEVINHLIGGSYLLAWHKQA